MALNQLDGAGSNREQLGQRKWMKIHHEICCLAAQYKRRSLISDYDWGGRISRSRSFSTVIVVNFERAGGQLSFC